VQTRAPALPDGRTLALAGTQSWRSAEPARGTAPGVQELQSALQQYVFFRALNDVLAVKAGNLSENHTPRSYSKFFALPGARPECPYLP